MESPSGVLAPPLSQAWPYVRKLHRRSNSAQGAEGKLHSWKLQEEPIYQDAQRASTVTCPCTAHAHLQL